MRVAALIVIDGRVVTVRHRSGDARYHLLPGGGVGYRETLEDALCREVREETGLHVRIARPLVISDTIDPTGPRHVVNILFAATVVGGSITESPEDERVEAVDLVTPADLSGIDLRPPWADVVRRVLTEDEGFHAAYLGSIFSTHRCWPEE